MPSRLLSLEKAVPVGAQMPMWRKIQIVKNLIRRMGCVAGSMLLAGKCVATPATAIVSAKPTPSVRQEVNTQVDPDPMMAAALAFIDRPVMFHSRKEQDDVVR